MTMTGVEIINLTPHDVTFILPEGEEVVIKPSGELARVATSEKTIGSINGIPVTKTVFKEVENLPEPKDGTVFVVSMAVASRVPEREDVFIPSNSVRDDRGRIIGARTLGVM